MWIDDAEIENLQRWSKRHEQEQRHEEDDKEGTRQDAEREEGSEKAKEGRKETTVIPVRRRDLRLGLPGGGADAAEACRTAGESAS
jgi:hypothetical protein